MDVAVIIGAVICAVSAVIAAMKANTGIRETRRVRSMLQAYLTEPQDARSVRALNRKERPR